MSVRRRGHSALQAARVLQPLRVCRAKGQAALEFSLSLIILVALLYGLLEVSRLVLTRIEIENAAREGSQYAALHLGTTGEYLRENVLPAKLPLIGAGPNLQVSDPQYPAGGTGPYLPVTVTVVYTWTSWVSFVPSVDPMGLHPLGPIRLEAIATSLIESR
jgi:Flp pilus assembly protein TadG